MLMRQSVWFYAADLCFNWVEQLPEEKGYLLIRAVLHQAREIKPDLFD